MHIGLLSGPLVCLIHANLRRVAHPFHFYSLLRAAVRHPCFSAPPTNVDSETRQTEVRPSGCRLPAGRPLAACCRAAGSGIDLHTFKFFFSARSVDQEYLIRMDVAYACSARVSVSLRIPEAPPPQVRLSAQSCYLKMLLVGEYVGLSTMMFKLLVMTFLFNL